MLLGTLAVDENNNGATVYSTQAFTTKPIALTAIYVYATYLR